MSEGAFPKLHKVARIVVICKGGDKTNSNRPVTLLSIFIKIFKRMLHKRLFRFLKNHEFRHTNLLSTRLVNSASLITNTKTGNKNIGINVFLYFSKAFDSVIDKIFFSKRSPYATWGCGLNLVHKLPLKSWAICYIGFYIVQADVRSSSTARLYFRAAFVFVWYKWYQ